MIRHRGYVLKIDDKEFEKPIDFLDYQIWQHHFPNMDRYTMSRKLHRLGEYIEQKNKTLAGQEKKEIDQIILQKHGLVKWELIRLKVDPIEYVQSRKINDMRFLKQYESHR